MGASVSRTDFTFSYTDEPHATRRKLILSKYPQVKQLMGVDEMFKYQVIAIVIAQFVSFYLLRDTANFWILFALAYAVGGTANHALMLAIHELSHSMGYGPGRPLANKLLGMFANLPIGAPIVISFKKYHLDHHRYQGDETLDTDVPTYLEVRMFRSMLTKIVWCFLQPLFYTLRPFFVNPKAVEPLELVNIVVQIAFNFFIYKTLGIHIVYYMLAGSALAMGLHPVAGHFISEHFLFNTKSNTKIHHNQDTNNNNNQHYSNNLNMSFQQQQQQHYCQRQPMLPKITEDDETNFDANQACSTLSGDGQFLIPETCSYYGPLNWLTFNVGYHVEHHDFPSIPGSRLAQLQKIAPEFYLTLNYHTSWVKVIWKYVTDPRVGPAARVRRPTKINKLKL